MYDLTSPVLNLSFLILFLQMRHLGARVSLKIFFSSYLCAYSYFITYSSVTVFCFCSLPNITSTNSTYNTQDFFQIQRTQTRRKHNHAPTSQTRKNPQRNTSVEDTSTQKCYNQTKFNLLYTFNFNDITSGCAIAQAVSRWLPTEAARVQSSV
jgi:hypothetical protein